MDPAVYARNLKSQTNNSGLDDPSLLKIAQESIANLREHPIAMEDLLTIRAESLGIDIQSLETEESRNIANDSIKTASAHLAIKIKGLDLLILLNVSNYIDKIIEKVNLGDGYEVIEQCTKAIKVFSDAMSRLDLHTGGTLSQTRVLTFKLVEKLDKLFKELNPFFQAVGLGVSAEEMILPIKALYLLQLDASKALDSKMPLKAFSAWCQGDEEVFHNELPVDPNNLRNKKKMELSFKQTSVRDAFMLDKMINDLQTLSKDNRSFYAIGSAHITDNYKNIKVVLEEKGWKIKNAYKM